MYRIIIADDEEYVRELLANNINRSQKEYQVVGKAENGTAALALVKELKPDILITDICMPKTDGLELLRQIQALDLKLETIIISGYDDFDYAKQALRLGVTDYLLKPFSPEELYQVLEKIKAKLIHQKTLMNNIEDMKNQLKDSRQMFQEQALQHLIQKTKPAGQLREEAEKAGIDLNTPLQYAAGIFRIHTASEHQEEKLTEFLTVIKDTYFQERCHAYLTRIHEKQIVILFAGDHHSARSFQKNIRESLSSLSESMEKYYDLKICCIIGGIYQDWQRIGDSYKDALSVWRGILDSQEQIVFYDEEVLHSKEEREGLFERPKALEQQLLIHIQMGQADKAEESLYEILRYYESMHVRLSDFVSISLVELVFDISSTLMKAGGQGLVWKDENVVEYLKEHFAYGSLRDAQEVLRSYVLKCCEQFASVNKKQGDRIVFQIKELIEKNLANEDFNLETASGMLYFSSNYVRQIFRQIAGESFMEYLIRRRMETAKELLENTALKVQDVAIKTGYSNQRYFASYFKKYYGCTPTEYRNQLEKRL